MRHFDQSTDPPETIHAALTARDQAANAEVESAVRTILDDVRARGDAAVLDYTRRFDWPNATAPKLEMEAKEFDGSLEDIGTELRTTLILASRNIEAFHEAEHGHLQSWMHLQAYPYDLPRKVQTATGTFVGQVLQPVKRVGIYVPGGKALYPSTVMMAAIPAKVAGVEQIIVCTPPDQRGKVSLPITAGLNATLRYHKDRVFKIGGAQAIAAMAYGTETVPKVDVIVGPGNAYVNTAKRMVYGEVGIDMLAGPSEVAIIADGSANPAFVAADLLAQTEHGPDNKGVLFSPSTAVLEQCKIELERQRARLSRQEILAATAENWIFVRTNSLEDAFVLSNVLAPEHLELHVSEPLAVLPLVKNAGAVLLGGHTSASIGDYWAGPSHTLPTAGTARFSSPLSVATFMKRTSVIYYSPQAAAEVAADVARFAHAEGFDAHAQAARLRASPPLPTEGEGWVEGEPRS